MRTCRCGKLIANDATLCQQCGATPWLTWVLGLGLPLLFVLAMMSCFIQR